MQKVSPNKKIKPTVYFSELYVDKYYYNVETDYY